MTDRFKSESISRKDFIRTGAFGAMGLGLGLNEAIAESQSKSARAKVVLVREKAAMTAEGQKDAEVLEGMLGKALCAYTGEKDAVAALGHFIKPGDSVGVKMNVMMIPTQSELIAGLARMLVRLGVKDEKIIIWDRDNAGIGVGGAYTRNKKYGYSPDAVSRIITDEVSALINIPALKSHWLSGMAGALKNWCGAVTRINVRDIDTPYPIHKDSCADIGRLGAIEAIRSKSRLVIIDALRPLFEGGPQVNPAYLWYYGGLFVSQDPVAADTICTELLIKKREQYKGRSWPLSPPPKHVTFADTRYGLGVSEREKIDLVALGEEKDRLI